MGQSWWSSVPPVSILLFRQSLLVSILLFQSIKPIETNPQPTKPPNQTTTMHDWHNSKARLIVIHDLEENVVPLNEDDMSTEVAWERYHGLDEFADVPFSQFKEHLREHREKLAEKLSAR